MSQYYPPSLYSYGWAGNHNNMSIYYKSQRTRNLYVPNSNKPFRLSRSKIDQMVCKLYSLTDEEIKIVENN